MQITFGSHLFSSLAFIGAYAALWMLLYFKFRKEAYSVKRSFVILLLLLFPTLNREKKHELIYMGDGNYEELKEHAQASPRIEISIAPFLFSLHDLFVIETCGHVYEKGFRKGQLYCKSRYALPAFNSTAQQPFFHVSALLISTIMSVMIYLFMLRNKLYKK